jgi:tRNA pseudouridine32 synthase/23S rRNA pseudouridine746 synthase
MKEPENRIEHHLQVESTGDTAVNLLQRASGLSKGRIKSAMSKGAVWLTRGKTTQRLRRATRKLQSGDELHLYHDESVLAEVPAAPELIADAGDYSVWNKPYGLRSQGSKWGDHCTVTRWAEQHLQPERSAFVVHRLDRAASGLILVAHAKRTAAALSEIFKRRKIEKRYQAWVAGDFSEQPDPLLRVGRCLTCALRPAANTRFVGILRDWGIRLSVIACTAPASRMGLTCS